MTLYETLGVSKDASKTDIKKAYRKHASNHHPDRANGDEAKFKEIQLAYDVLGDEEKKTRYDRGDAPNKVSPQDKARNELASLFDQVLGDPNHEYSNPLKVMDDCINTQISNFKKQKHQIVRGRKRLLKAKRELRSITDFDILGGVIKNKRTQAAKSYLSMREALLVMEALRNLLNDYEFTGVVPTKTTPTINTFGSGTTTTILFR